MKNIVEDIVFGYTQEDEQTVQNLIKNETDNTKKKYLQQVLQKIKFELTSKQFDRKENNKMSKHLINESSEYTVTVYDENERPYQSFSFDNYNEASEFAKSINFEQNTDWPNCYAVLKRIEKHTIDESHYGGAYDIEDDQYFTKDELVELAEVVADDLSYYFDGDIDYHDVYMQTDRDLSITISINDVEEEIVKHIDLRKLKYPNNLITYSKEFVADFVKQFVSDGLKLKNGIKNLNDNLNGSSDDPYEEWGSRKNYLKSLADEYEVPFETVWQLASVLGRSEDFDALITEIEDFAETQNDEYHSGNDNAVVYIVVYDSHENSNKYYRYGVVPYYEYEMSDVNDIMKTYEDRDLVGVYKLTEKEWREFDMTFEDTQLRAHGDIPDSWKSKDVMHQKKSVNESVTYFDGTIRLNRQKIKELNKICQKYCGWKLPKEIAPLYDELEAEGVDVGMISGTPNSVAADGAKSWTNEFTYNGSLVLNSSFIYDVYEGNGDSLKNEYNIYFS